MRDRPLLLVGAQRSGTTALGYALSEAHASRRGCFTVNGKLFYLAARWLHADDLAARHLRVDELCHALTRRRPGGAGAAETDHVFRLSGMMKALEDEGGHFFDHNRPPFVEVELKYHPKLDVTGPQKTVMVNPRVLEYETLISLSQLKIHDTATVTMALKNIAMSFPAADYYGHPRSRQDHENFFFADMHSFIAAMAERFPIDLAITVGHPAMIGSGPIGGHVVETGLAIASTDAVAADVVGARILGFWPQGVRHLWEAGRMGLGEADLDAISYPALDIIDAIEVFTSIVYGERRDFRHV